jgi:homoserine acetyltransferase
MGNQRVLSSTERYIKHTENNTTVEYAPLSLLQDCLIHVKKWLQKTYNLLQTVASKTLDTRSLISLLQMARRPFLCSIVSSDNLFPLDICFILDRISGFDRVCVQSSFHGDLESELEDDVVQQVDKVFTEIPTENKENLQRILQMARRPFLCSIVSSDNLFPLDICFILDRISGFCTMLTSLDY